MGAVSAGLGPRSAELLEVMARTADGMIAIDPQMRIVGWNDAATELLGYSADEVLDRPCFEVLGWHDSCGNGVCDPGCPAFVRTFEGELIETRETMGQTKSGQAVWLSVSTVVPPERLRKDCQMVHFVREGGLPPALERVLVERLRGPAAAADGMDEERRAALEGLTLRERDVLRLLTEGLDTSEIAARLVLSPTTVRNHVQHVLAKLNVHSRVEAVALALRNPR